MLRVANGYDFDTDFVAVKIEFVIDFLVARDVIVT